jgi:hypothetical protein
MAKKKTRHKTTQPLPDSGAKQPLQKSPANDGQKESAGQDDPWDFGGLPDRDLKKNLGGCG